DPAKLRWGARLFKRELEDRPGQLYYQIEYGKILLMLQDPAGHKVLAEAAEQVRAQRESPAPPTLHVQRLLEYLVTVSPAHSRSRVSREEAWELAERWFPNSPPLLWARASQLFAANDFVGAAELLQRLVLLGETGSYDRSEAFEPSIIGETALMNLGACFT